MTTLRNIILTTIIIGLFACNSDTKKNNIDNSHKDASETEKISLRQVFPENSIGVAYLDTLNDTDYTLTIRFPHFTLPDSVLARDTSNYTKDISVNLPPQTIILFDEAGNLTTLENVTNCISKFWCENDGGIQYEPTYILTVPKDKFNRQLTIKNKNILGKISAFAVINFNAYHFNSFYPDSGSENHNIVMRGRLSTDYSGYAYKTPEIYKYYDRNVQISFSMDDSGMSDYCIFLEAFNNRQNNELGCCGP